MNRFSTVCLAFAQLSLIASLTGGLGGLALAQSSPSLEGETFQYTGTALVTVACKPDGSYITFSLKGNAIGPFPGIFKEEGQLVFYATGAEGKLAFSITDLTDGASKEVATGTKTITDGTLTCAVDPKTGATTFVVKANLTYDAQIGGVVDAGEATLDIAGVVQKDVASPFQFTQIFHSSQFANTPGKVTGGGQIEGPGTGVTFGFTAQSDGNDMKGSGVLIDRTLGVRIKIVTVEAFGQSGTHAAFSGQADVNGQRETYRIDVDDLVEPGAGGDTFKITTDTYSIGGTLTGGNIQAHR